MNTKICFKCGKKKPIEKYYKHKMMEDGHLNKCISCTKKDVKSRYYDPKFRDKIRQYEKLRFKDPERKKKLKEYQRIRRRKFPGKDKARSLTKKLEKLPCEICGDRKVQAHHIDYRSALRVRWLCFKHHRETHGQQIGYVLSKNSRKGKHPRNAQYG